MTPRKIFNGRALYVDFDKIWVAKGTVFWGINRAGDPVTPKFEVGSQIEKVIGCSRLTRQLIRGGIHHLIPLKNGGYLVTLKGKTLILDGRGKVVKRFDDYRGNKPAHRGICVSPGGDILFGEYTINLNNNNPTSLYRSKDNGISFHRVLTFDRSYVRHIHFLEWDKYDNCLWMGTGDKDHECFLMKSTDGGDNWEVIGGGTQLWRAVGIACSSDYLFWGTDAGSVPHPNYIMRMNKKTTMIEQVQEVQGPCHGNAVLADGTIFVSTGVEGGANEKDSFAHLWKVEKNGSINEVLKIKKDIFPHIVQYGVIRFPLATDNCDAIVYTTYALKENGEAVYIDER